MSADKLTVLVTAIGGGGHGEQIVKALALAARYHILGADMNPNCPQFDRVEKGFVLPPASSPGFIDAVLSLCRAHGVAAVFHGCEPELLAYSRNRSRFASSGVLLPINRAETIELCMDKALTHAFLQEQGFRPPATALAGSVDDALAVAPFPLVLKPHVGTGASKDCFIVQDEEELAGVMMYLKVGPVRPMLVQEYVGTPESEFTVGVLHDLDGRYLNAIALRRELKSALNLRSTAPNLTGRAELGPRLAISSGISMGELGRFPAVTEACRRIATALDVRGAINIQGRMTQQGFRVFEINPRFSGTTSIRAMMGYNEPDVLLRRHLLGETVIADFPYEEGYVLRGLVEFRPSHTAAPVNRSGAPQ
jgi:carbamoyl-phosphate synthase large subunit